MSDREKLVEIYEEAGRRRELAGECDEEFSWQAEELFNFILESSGFNEWKTTGV